MSLFIGQGRPLSANTRQPKVASTVLMSVFGLDLWVYCDHARLTECRGIDEPGSDKRGSGNGTTSRENVRGVRKRGTSGVWRVITDDFRS